MKPPLPFSASICICGLLEQSFSLITLFYRALTNGLLGCAGILRDDELDVGQTCRLRDLVVQSCDVCTLVGGSDVDDEVANLTVEVGLVT